MIAIAGIGIIFGFHPQYKVGILFGIISAMGSALFPIFNKEFVKKFEPQMVTFYELGGRLITLTILVPLYLMQFPATYYIPTLSDWIWLLVLAWFCTVLGFHLQLNALKKISAFTANLTYNLEPVWYFAGLYFFNEGAVLNEHFYWGLALIILVILHMLRVRNQSIRNK
jgi:drug/metabolite transporter (DMT)-like permease